MLVRHGLLQEVRYATALRGQCVSAKASEFDHRGAISKSAHEIEWIEVHTVEIHDEYIAVRLTLQCFRETIRRVQTRVKPTFHKAYDEIFGALVAVDHPHAHGSRSLHVWSLFDTTRASSGGNSTLQRWKELPLVLANSCD